ncbi:MAG: hypothetical protein WCX82_02245, partial [archaeon]
ITVLALVLIVAIYYFQGKSGIHLPSGLQLSIILFIYGGVFLGGVQNFYLRFWWWDSLLHLFSGFTLALIAFGIMYFLYKTEKIKANFVFIAVIVFSLSMTIGTVWEVYEFAADNTFGLNMQKARNLCPATGACDSRLGLLDTMKDTILNAVGALLVSILGYIYLKNGEQFFLNKIMKRFVRKNPRLFFK